MQVENLKSFDPFAVTEGEEGFDGGSKGSFVHLRIQQRSGRKKLTTCQGLASDLNLKKILKAFKKVSGLIHRFDGLLNMKGHLCRVTCGCAHVYRPSCCIFKQTEAHYCLFFCRNFVAMELSLKIPSRAKLFR